VHRADGDRDLLDAGVRGQNTRDPP